MILTDIHTHTKFSADGRGDIRDMIETALAKGISYYGISEHVNYDYTEQGIEIEGETENEINIPLYFQTPRALQEEYRGRLHLLIGCEFGFHDGPFCFREYQKIIDSFHPDFVVNSIHTCMGEECYFPEYTRGKEKRDAYNAYFQAVLASLDAPYPYDIVAHIGYCSRNAVYADPKIRYEDFSEILDRILYRIVEKDKILEINTSSKTAGSPFLPDTDILRRYYEMGGRKVSYASDAHDPSRIMEKRDIVVAALKKIGFSCLSVPDCGKILQIEI